MTIPSPNMGLVIFVIITVIYFIVNYVTKEKHNAVAFMIYIILLFAAQFGISVSLTKSLCGETHLKTAFLYTLIP